MEVVRYKYSQNSPLLYMYMHIALDAKIDTISDSHCLNCTNSFLKHLNYGQVLIMLRWRFAQSDTLVKVSSNFKIVKFNNCQC